MEKNVYEFISKQTDDPIVERKTCKVSGEPFAIFQSDLDFYDKISPTFDGKKYVIPLPTLCPDERLKRRCVAKNNGKFYRRPCDLTGKPIVSLYSPDFATDKSGTVQTKYIVYEQKTRRSDKRDPMNYGKEFDFSKSFTEQYKALLIAVPKISIMNDNATSSENCEYCQDFAYGKNCYLTHSSWKIENCYYGFHVLDNSKFLVDCDEIINSEHCYQSIDCDKCFSCLYCTNCLDCSFCLQSYHLTACSYCIGCSNLSNKQYYIDNKPSTKEEYEKTMKDKTRYSFLSAVLFHKALDNFNSTQCQGNNNFNCKKSAFVYDNKGVEDSKYAIWWTDTKYSYDVTMTWAPNLSYDSMTCDEWYGILFSVFCRKCTNVMYSDFCHGCQHCFWCAGLKNKSYCIFNKQYTREEYEKFVPKIIEKMEADWERWGFFHPSLSCFAYNETFAQEYFPLTREEALARWYRRMDKEYPINVPEGTTIIDASQIETLKSDEEILKVAIKCEVSWKPFRVIKPELDFYRKHNLPLPHKHPDIRHQERLAQRPPKELRLRACGKCWIEMLSVYTSDSEFKVYCEACYTKEIYW